MQSVCILYIITAKITDASDVQIFLYNYCKHGEQPEKLFKMLILCTILSLSKTIHNTILTAL